MSATPEDVETVARAMEPNAFAVYDKGYTCMNVFDQRAFLNAKKKVNRTRRVAKAAIAALIQRGWSPPNSTASDRG